MRARMQRQIPGLAAFARYAQVRHVLPRMPEVPDFQLAQFVAAKGVEQQRREDRAVTPALERAGVRSSALSTFGRATPLTGLWVTAFCSHRYSNSDASDDSRCRTVLAPDPRRTSSSRQAMMWARVTARNSSGRLMPVKRTKSFTAAPSARQVSLLVRLANHLISGATSARRWNSAAVSSREPRAGAIGS